jgi:uncharacterized protein YqgC (DUF456 family)
MEYVFWLLLILVLGLGWSLTLFGLPGNWLMVVSLAVFAAAFPEQETGPGLNWETVAILAGLAVLGEVLEFLSGAATVTRGGSRRGAVLAMVGSLVGSAVGAAIGAPFLIGLPVVIVLGACLGAMIGAALGETWKGRSGQVAVEIGKAAFWSRLFGSLAKLMIGGVILAVGAIAAF